MTKAAPQNRPCPAQRPATRSRPRSRSKPCRMGWLHWPHQSGGTRRHLWPNHSVATAPISTAEPAERSHGAKPRLDESPRTGSLRHPDRHQTADNTRTMARLAMHTAPLWTSRLLCSRLRAAHHVIRQCTTTRSADADVCRFLAAMHAKRGPVPRTNRGQTIKRPDRLSGDQASDLHFLVAGAGFEPATSGL
jgi:hypothetical protein